MFNRRGFMIGAGAAVAASRAASAQARREVSVGLTQDVLTLDPANHRNRDTERVLRNIYDGLLTRDADMRVLPELCESFRQIDPTNYEFKLRAGIKFHSGAPLTAADVKFTFDRIVKDCLLYTSPSPRD